MAKVITKALSRITGEEKVIVQVVAPYGANLRMMPTLICYWEGFKWRLKLVNLLSNR
jgi:hypothetical protein